MRALVVVEAAQLGGPAELGRDLLDVYVRALGIGRRGRGGRWRRVLLYVQGDWGGGYGLAEEPGDALESESGLGGVGQGLVLFFFFAGVLTMMPSAR